MSTEKLREVVPMLASDFSLSVLDREGLERVYTEYASRYWAEMFVSTFGLDRAHSWDLFEQ